MKRKARISFIIPVLGQGGAEHVMATLASYMQSSSLQFDLIAIFDSRKDYPIHENVQYYYIGGTSPYKLLRYLHAFFCLPKLLRNLQSDLVIGFVYSQIIMTTVVGKMLGIKVLSSERTDPKSVPDKAFHRWLRNRMFGQADMVVFQTAAAKDYFSKKIQEKGVVIPNPISENLPKANPNTNNNVIVTASRLHPQKNIRMLIEAFSYLVQQHPAYQLHIYGYGPQQEELEQLVKDKGLANKVLFKGFSTKWHVESQDATMFVLSSDYEGVSNSMLEAMAMGLPMVITDHPPGGARIFVQEYHNAILTPVGDANAFFLAMKRIIEHPELAQELTQNAYRLRQDFTPDKIAAQWESIIKKTLWGCENAEMEMF